MTKAAVPDPSARDFPYYNSRPVAVSVLGWLTILIFTAAGFAALFLAPDLLPETIGRPVKAALFVVLPLVGLALTTGRHWSSLFPPLTRRDVWIGLAFVPLPTLAAVLVAIPLERLGLTAPNAAIDLMQHLHGADRVRMMLATLPQLLGEELVTILPFLAILALASRGLKASRRTAITAAWILSAAIFGALHLSTYDWHVAQAVGVIGVSRLMLTLPYLITKSPWASAITHIVHDWALFSFVLIVGSFEHSA